MISCITHDYFSPCLFRTVIQCLFLPVNFLKFFCPLKTVLLRYSCCRVGFELKHKDLNILLLHLYYTRNQRWIFECIKGVPKEMICPFVTPLLHQKFAMDFGVYERCNKRRCNFFCYTSKSIASCKCNKGVTKGIDMSLCYTPKSIASLICWEAFL